MATKSRDAVLIVNPTAGGGRRMRQLDEARRIFRESGIETELQNTTAAGEATIWRATRWQPRREMVIVCGGDGTVNEVVNGLACSQVPLAVLPAGTANVLAKELALPWNLPKAAERIVNAPYRRIALGLAIPEKSSGEPRYFLSVAGAGADGALVAAVRPEIKLKAGILAYWQEGLRQLTQIRFPDVSNVYGGQFDGYRRFAGGRRPHKNYGGPFKITTEADLMQPEFELAFVTTRSAWRYMAYLPLLWAGKLRGARHVKFFKTDSLQCASNSDIPCPNPGGRRTCRTPTRRVPDCSRRSHPGHP